MKKISLKSIAQGLKRDEMRMIQGGSGCGYPAGEHCVVGHDIFNCAVGLTCIRDNRFPNNSGYCA